MRRYLTYLPLPILIYLLYKVEWSSEALWIVSLGILLGINLAILILKGCNHE